MGDLALVDPVAIARRALLASPGIVEALGGPDQAPDRIGPDNTPPYPYLRLIDAPGSDLGLVHLVAPVVQVEVIGDPDGTPGKPTMRALLYHALQVLAAIPTVPTDPGAPVITAVRSTGGGGWSPLPTGQPRYIATVQMYGHPPRFPTS